MAVIYGMFEFEGNDISVITFIPRVMSRARLQFTDRRNLSMLDGIKYFLYIRKPVNFASVADRIDLSLVYGSMLRRRVPRKISVSTDHIKSEVEGAVNQVTHTAIY